MDINSCVKWFFPLFWLAMQQLQFFGINGRLERRLAFGGRRRRRLPATLTSRHNDNHIYIASCQVDFNTHGCTQFLLRQPVIVYELWKTRNQEKYRRKKKVSFYWTTCRNSKRSRITIRHLSNLSFSATTGREKKRKRKRAVATTHASNMYLLLHWNKIHSTK